MPLHSGLTLAGDLVLVEKLAEGGQGHVWRALDTTHQRVVAVKVLRATAEPGSRAHTRFLREAQHLASFDHPGLTALLRYDLEAEPPWMAMELADGIPLSTLLKLSANFGRPLTPGMVRTIVEQVASALAHAHAHGVVHRDLKPSNVVVGERVRVVDFGIAKLLDEELTQLTTVMRGPVGTLGYLAPEQLEGHEVTPRTDLHALGVLGYVMLTGRLPWLRPGDSTADLRGLICQRVLSEERPAVREWRPELAPAVDEVLRVAMALDPAARLASVEQLADLLGAALGPAEPLDLHASEALPFEVTRSDVDAAAHVGTKGGGLPADLAVPMGGLVDSSVDTPRATESGPRGLAPMFDDLIGTLEVEPALLPFQGMVDDLTVSARPPEVTRTRPMVHLSEAERAHILQGAHEAVAAPRTSRPEDGSSPAAPPPRLSAPPLLADATALGAGSSSTDSSALLPGSMPGMSLPPGVLVAGARGSLAPVSGERRARPRRWSAPVLVLAALSLLVAGGVLALALRPPGVASSPEVSRSERPAPAAIGAVPSVVDHREVVVTSGEPVRETPRATPGASPRPGPSDATRVTKAPATPASSVEAPPSSPASALVPIAPEERSTPRPPSPVEAPSDEAFAAALTRIAQLEETWLQRSSASRADEVISIRDRLLELTRGRPEADSLRVSLDDSRFAGDLSDVQRLRRAAERARDAAR